MSNKLFQGIIYQMKDVMGRTVGVVDSDGIIIACSDVDRLGEPSNNITGELLESCEVVSVDNYTYKPFSLKKTRCEYVAFAKGADEAAATYCHLISISLENIKFYYDEKYDRVGFLKNVVLDNVLPGDIYVKSRELHFNSDVQRVVFLVKVLTSTEISVYDVLISLFPDRQKDFIFNISENEIVIVKEVKSVDSKDFEKLARSMVDTLNGEYYTKAVVGIGKVVSGIKEIARSFREAQSAIDIGKIFDTEKPIVNYDNLGIARLIYQLPPTLCEMYLREIFKKGSIDSLEYETLFTIQKFFENNLNVSETARNLFVHRNTLVYRLEKIKKLTGLDLREFEQAIVFKVALMVKKYLVANKSKF
ncbi:MAG: helix-turn-helix domain-containing protein [Oscillospiraceae bacterium]|jgi:carbohydrate diacid regulator|nr:helix-turn-helix domain-containing protein [Oscillospiraceae bacterium]